MEEWELITAPALIRNRLPTSLCALQYWKYGRLRKFYYVIKDGKKEFICIAEKIQE